jgi:LDH2 family malate/lactate/ureidoglycolate dehydrogenase
MEVGVVHVSIDEAERMTADALRAIGWDADDAALQAEIMTAAELCGNNQGLVKMYQPHLMAPSPDYAGKPIVTRETASSAVIDARQSPGMLAAVTAADLVVQKLRSTEDAPPLPPPTIAIVCTHNSSTSSGQLAFYVERMARRGIIGLALCNSPEFVAAAPRAKPVFGTNPLAVSVPVSDSDYPFTVSLFDRCVCVCVYGKCFF